MPPHPHAKRTFCMSTCKKVSPNMQTLFPDVWAMSTGTFADSSVSLVLRRVAFCSAYTPSIHVQLLESDVGGQYLRQLRRSTVSNVVLRQVQTRERNVPAQRICPRCGARTADVVA